MTKCIIHQLEIKGVKKENIHDIEFCTFCNKEFELHSYRKNIINTEECFHLFKNKFTNKRILFIE